MRWEDGEPVAVQFEAENDQDAVKQAKEYVNPEAMVIPDYFLVTTLHITKLNENIQRNGLILFDSRDD
jgi:hypothetical protein